MADKFEFASPEWVGVAREYVEKVLADQDLTGVRISFCEEFTDPPPHLSPDGSSIGWHMLIDRGQVTVAPGVVETDTKVVADYDTILPLARTEIDPGDADQAAELTAMMAEAMEAGKFTPPSGGTPSHSLDVLAGLHNHLALHTR